ncbi:AraC family transcriptional regulator [Myxococcus sp. Y35]|uniref:AraC family transcriptional regulator n=1 Tax=Pseudomyxococcus flavus TaxID=3115648 RepID=UPI003CE8A7F0
MPERPSPVADPPDVVSDVLETLRLSTVLFGRFELGAPWALRLPKKENATFYVLAHGQMRLRVDGVAPSFQVSAGDVVLVPQGSAHVLDDGTRRAPAARDFIPAEALRGPVAAPCRLGGAGPVSTLITGCFRFSSGVQSPLLASLPPAIHLSAQEPQVASWLSSTVRLIDAESQARKPGSALVLGRLADVLLVQAFRARAETSATDGAGLQALSDPTIGAALGLMHGRLGEPWTVERLAASVGVSRSGFAARFHQLVGEPPLQYLARWRMTKAAQWLRETQDTLPEVAERVGYVSPVAFNKAFKRWHGVGPGGYRRMQDEVRY